MFTRQEQRETSVRGGPTTSQSLAKQSRESWRTHTASVSPTDVRSDPFDSLVVNEVPKTLLIPVDSLPWRTTRISPLRLWTPPVNRIPVRTGQRTDQDSPKAAEPVCDRKVLQSPRASGPETSLLPRQCPTCRVRVHGGRGRGPAGGP